MCTKNLGAFLPQDSDEAKRRDGIIVPSRSVVRHWFSTFAATAENVAGRLKALCQQGFQPT